MRHFILPSQTSRQPKPLRWINIDPHLLLFAFLPALLFGDAKSTDTHLLARKIKEILTLASVGVLVGTFLTAGEPTLLPLCEPVYLICERGGRAVCGPKRTPFIIHTPLTYPYSLSPLCSHRKTGFTHTAQLYTTTPVVAKYYLPYEWGWNLSLVLGSILAATDPVAVVGLLNSLGAPPAITMIIAGESMFNDGTAIVVFNLFLSLYSVEFEIEGALTDYAFTNATDILFYAFKAVVGGTMFGLAGTSPASELILHGAARKAQRAAQNATPPRSHFVSPPCPPTYTHYISQVASSSFPSSSSSTTSCTKTTRCSS